MMKRLLAAAAVVVAAALPQSAQAAFEKKVALVVGNGAYANVPALANPVNDAKAVAAAFERLGFDVVTGYDLDVDGMNKTVRQFARESHDAQLTAFYYAGHGMSFEGTNYMIPVDARFDDPTALRYETVSVDDVTDQMRYADGVSLVFLDACRDNPFVETLTRSMGFSTRSAGLGRGLAAMDVTGAGKGLAIAFATAPGQVAYDGGGQHSPFTSALLNHIEARDADITEVMSRVTGDVLRATEEKQRPWLNASLTGPVVLNPAPIAPVQPEVQVAALSPDTAVGVVPAPLVTQPQATGPTRNLEAQKLLFDVAQDSKKASDYRAYLSMFPDGLFANNAKAAIQELERKQPVTTAALAPAAVGAAAVGVAAANANTPQAEAVAVPQIPLDKTPTTQATEQAMGMNRTARREVQTRLNLAGYNVGGADGMFGRKTRAGIIAWQASRELPQTGYLSSAQMAALSQQTQAAYTTHLASAPATSTRSVNRGRATTKRASTKRKSTRKRTAKRRTTKRRSTRRRSSRGNCGAGCAAFIGGVAGGIVGGLIAR